MQEVKTEKKEQAFVLKELNGFRVFARVGVTPDNNPCLILDLLAPDRPGYECSKDLVNELNIPLKETLYSEGALTNLETPTYVNLIGG